MSTIFTIAAIAMFAVTLGLGLMSPALASQPDENGKHKTLLCHFQEEKTIIVDDEDGDETNDLQDCLDLLPVEE